MELLSNIICEIENLLMNRDGAAMCFAFATCVISLWVHCGGILKMWSLMENSRRHMEECNRRSQISGSPVLQNRVYVRAVIFVAAYIAGWKLEKLFLFVIFSHISIFLGKTMSARSKRDGAWVWMYVSPLAL